MNVSQNQFCILRGSNVSKMCHIQMTFVSLVGKKEWKRFSEVSMKIFSKRIKSITVYYLVIYWEVSDMYRYWIVSDTDTFPFFEVSTTHKSYIWLRLLLYMLFYLKDLLRKNLSQNFMIFILQLGYIGYWMSSKSHDFYLINSIHVGFMQIWKTRIAN